MTDRRSRVPAWLAVACLAGAAPAAQQVFKVRADLVMLNVTVLDAAGRLVPGLERGDFQVFEDGVPQEISNFTRDPQPIALALVLDSSVSMENKLKTAQTAAIGFVRRMSSRDAAQVIEFNSHVRILQPFTADAALLEAAIRRTEAAGSTSLHNAIYVAIAEFKKERARTVDDVRRQAVIVLSDGEDTSSVVPFELVLDEAKRSEVMVYAIGLRPKDAGTTTGWKEAEYVLRTIAHETGGRSYRVEESSGLAAIYEQIADELANQYTIGYSSKNVKRDGTWRRVALRVGRPDTLARTKSGYFAPTTPRQSQ
jgi:Ca-activated chloride channel family protein